MMPIKPTTMIMDMSITSCISVDSAPNMDISINVRTPIGMFFFNFLSNSLSIPTKPPSAAENTILPKTSKESTTIRFKRIIR